MANKELELFRKVVSKQFGVTNNMIPSKTDIERLSTSSLKLDSFIGGRFS